ncbi:hypothetical protein ACFV29_31280 [Streptomyces sp. NPDC059690]|uniref:hypothetical protein n=1 Tax=Streptomyces sp. NPDC059690 TaxID=3346907 RepID=UPI0036809434
MINTQAGVAVHLVERRPDQILTAGGDPGHQPLRTGRTAGDRGPAAAVRRPGRPPGPDAGPCASTNPAGVVRTRGAGREPRFAWHGRTPGAGGGPGRIPDRAGVPHQRAQARRSRPCPVIRALPAGTLDDHCGG